MANQGLFTSGPSVDDLLQQRNTRALDLQRQLMQGAAQGARDPAKAQAVSFLGSSLGRALGGAMGGGDKEMEKLKAEAAQQKSLQQEALSVSSGTIAEKRAFINKIAPIYPQYAQDLNERVNQEQATQAQNLAEATAKKDALALTASKYTTSEEQKQAALDLQAQKKLEDELGASVDSEARIMEEKEVLLQNNALADTVASFMSPEDVANIRAGNKGAIDNAYRVKNEKRKLKAATLAGTDEASKLRFTEVGTFSDGKGNMYNATQSLDPQGKSKIIYTGIGSAPTYDSKKQKLSPTNTSGLTQEQQVAMVGAKADATAQAKSWEDAKVAARGARGDLLESQSFVTRALDILPKIRTGGLVVEGAKSFTDAFGITTDDVGEFHVLTATTALGMLRTTFGASPTEGERAILMSIQASIGNSEGLNKRILGRAKAMVEFRLKMNKKALTAKDAREYDAFLIEQEAPSWTDSEPSSVVTPAANTVVTPTAPTTVQWVKKPRGD
jgi:hypothetical protein